MKEFITVNQLTKSYQTGSTVVDAVSNLSFSIEESNLTVILGQSGAGKSTLLNLIGAMEKPSSGQIWINGENITDYSDRQQTLYRRRNIGFIFQTENLVQNLTALENVELMIEISNSQFDAKKALELTGLSERAHHFPSQLSGGEQQRISISRALASTPRLLLCDEPTSALDTQTSKRIISTIKNLTKEMDMTTLIITHNREVAKIADQVIELKDGQLVSNIHQDAPLEVEDLDW